MDGKGSILSSTKRTCRISQARIISHCTVWLSGFPRVSATPRPPLSGLHHCIGSKSFHAGKVSEAPFQPSRVTCMLFYILTVVLPYPRQWDLSYVTNPTTDRSSKTTKSVRQVDSSFSTASRQRQLLNRLSPAMSAGHRDRWV